MILNTTNSIHIFNVNVIKSHIDCISGKQNDINRYTHTKQQRYHGTQSSGN